MQSFKQANLLEFCVYSIFSLIPCYCSVLNDFITEPIEANRKTLMILALEIKNVSQLAICSLSLRDDSPIRQSNHLTIGMNNTRNITRGTALKH